MSNQNDNPNKPTSTQESPIISQSMGKKIFIGVIIGIIIIVGIVLVVSHNNKTKNANSNPFPTTSTAPGFISDPKSGITIQAPDPSTGISNSDALAAANTGAGEDQANASKNLGRILGTMSYRERPDLILSKIVSLTTVDARSKISDVLNSLDWKSCVATKCQLTGLFNTISSPAPNVFLVTVDRADSKGKVVDTMKWLFTFTNTDSGWIVSDASLQK
jgi:hypothetical protein